jgi:hypothetical protein
LEIDPSHDLGREPATAPKKIRQGCPRLQNRDPIVSLMARGSKRVRTEGKQHYGDLRMAKGYWVAVYRSISNPDGVAAYAKLAGPAIEASGGRFLARGTAAKAYESGI